MRVLFVAFFLIWSLAISVPATSLAETGAGQAIQRINIAGRQRMLTQRMTTAACLAMARVDEKNRSKVALAMRGEFIQGLYMLRHGAKGFDLPKEEDPLVLTALAEVEQVWAQFGPAIAQVVLNDMNEVVILQVLTLNERVLEKSNHVVLMLEKALNSGPKSDLGRTVNIAGRQRMLSQRMMKYACFAAIDLGRGESQIELGKDIELFDKTFVALRDGDAKNGIIAPPSAALSSHMNRVGQLWQTYRADLEHVQKGGDMPKDRLHSLAGQSDVILDALDQAVQMYVN
jgi:hypothetical protein